MEAFGRHYERAFEAYLRCNGAPFVSVDEARRSIGPAGAPAWRPRGAGGGLASGEGATIKSFDYVLYGHDANLLLDVKGRRVGGAGRAPKGASKGAAEGERTASRRPRRLENWVTREDITSLESWERLFGAGFRGAFAFVFWCADDAPPAGVEEVFEHGGRWYGVRAVLLADYVRCMKTRSRRWGTVDLPAAEFQRAARPFFAPEAVEGP